MTVIGKGFKNIALPYAPQSRNMDEVPFMCELNGDGQRTSRNGGKETRGNPRLKAAIPGNFSLGDAGYISFFGHRGAPPPIEYRVGRRELWLRPANHSALWLAGSCCLEAHLAFSYTTLHANRRFCKAWVVLQLCSSLSVRSRPVCACIDATIQQVTEQGRRIRSASTASRTDYPARSPPQPIKKSRPTLLFKGEEGRERVGFRVVILVVTLTGTGHPSRARLIEGGAATALLIGSSSSTLGPQKPKLVEDYVW
jgi:hypothetical protein